MFYSLLHWIRSGTQDAMNNNIFQFFGNAPTTTFHCFCNNVLLLKNVSSILCIDLSKGEVGASQIMKIEIFGELLLRYQPASTNMWALLHPHWCILAGI